MVLKRPRISSALIAAAMFHSGCLWMNDGAPDVVVVDPIDYVPEIVKPDTLPFLRGVVPASTQDAAAFLGTRDFRIAIAYSNRYNSYPDGANEVGVYVLEPSPDGGPLRILRYSRGLETYTGLDAALIAPTCRFSPRGDALLYSLAWPEAETMWIQKVASGNAWRVPLTSSRNRSLGVLGTTPFWLAMGNRLRIGFTAFRGHKPGESITHQGTPGGLALQPMGTRMVEVLGDTSLSEIARGQPALEYPGSVVKDVSRDGKWVLASINGSTYLLPAERIGDAALLGSSAALRPYKVEGMPSLNPFDSAATAHTDYWLAERYCCWQVPATREDSLYAPRYIDGRFPMVSGEEVVDEIWILDRDRRIILTHQVGGGAHLPHRMMRWSSHPNFVLTQSGLDLYATKLARNAGEILGNTEEATLSGVASFKLASLTAYAEGAMLHDASLWVGPEAP